MDELTEDFVNNELDLHNESIFTLEQDLKNHAKLEAKYHRWYSQANKKVNDLTLRLEMTVAKIVDEICERENITSYHNRAEIRRSRVASDKRYVAIRLKILPIL